MDWNKMRSMDANDWINTWHRMNINEHKLFVSCCRFSLLQINWMTPKSLCFSNTLTSRVHRIANNYQMGKNTSLIDGATIVKKFTLSPCGKHDRCCCWCCYCDVAMLLWDGALPTWKPSLYYRVAFCSSSPHA